MIRVWRVQTAIRFEPLAQRSSQEIIIKSRKAIRRTSVCPDDRLSKLAHLEPLETGSPLSGASRKPDRCLFARSWRRAIVRVITWLLASDCADRFSAALSITKGTVFLLFIDRPRNFTIESSC